MNAICPKCGNPTWQYESGRLQCSEKTCGHSHVLPQHARAFASVPLAAPPVEPGSMGLGLPFQSWECSLCKTLVLADQIPQGGCPNCGGSMQDTTGASLPELYTPAQVLPFTFPKIDAQKALRKWLRPNPLRPASWYNDMDPARLQGVYVPVWVFDIHAEATWDALAGYLYFNRLTEDDPHKTGEPWEVQQVRYAQTGGYYAHTFQQVYVPVGKSAFTDTVRELIQSEDLTGAVPYDPRYVEQWSYLASSSDLPASTAIASKHIEDQVEAAAKEVIDADLHRSLQVQLRQEGLQLSQLLIPVWVLTASYNGKRHSAVIHGRTGEVSGTQPWSWRRVSIAWLLACVGIIAAVAAVDAWLF